MSFVDSFRSAPPRQQLFGAALVAVVIAAVAVGAYFLLLRKPYEPLFTHLRTMDAATIVAELNKKKLPYRLADGGTTILAPHDQVDSMRLAVMSEDLPLKGTVGFELFNKSDMGLTEFAQRINFQRALQGELARTIMSIETIDTARVHLSLAEPSLFRDDRRPAKASVTLIPRAGSQISAQTVQGVQRLVAAAVPELATSDVVVLGADGRLLSGEAVSVAQTSNTDERSSIEGYFSARVRKAIAAIHPDADVAVTVSAILASGASGDAALDGWTPGARTFGLNVSITPASPLPPQTRTDVELAAADAIGLSQGLGDRVVVGEPSGLTEPVSALPKDTAAESAPLAPIKAKPAGLPTSQLVSGILTVILILLLGLAVALHLRARRSKVMSAKQRGDYVSRLRSLLDGEEGHVSPPV